MRALPRDIDPDVALRWMQNEEALARVLRDALMQNNISIVCDGSKASEMIARGYKCYLSKERLDELFPIHQRHESASRSTSTIELVKSDHDRTSEEVLADFRSRGLECPTYEEAICFGMQHSEKTRRPGPVVFLHQPVRDPYGYDRVIVLQDYATIQGLYLLNLNGHRWHRSNLFAAVRMRSY